ncbi:cyclic amp response element-binding protein a [Anaeramoeba flamelloides]|uniref:Cyclic amp response element-binding protein a n=1 Tax=Anaeramoeba flamelloides TaxID=1746091 RepID=A0ABQ8XI32_9EUKA|nr:cyclic amp response element-binding protein a [Anaeramoeba flamelloides]
MNEQEQAQAQDQLDSNLILPYSELDTGFKWDYTSFESEEKDTQASGLNSFSNTITCTNQLQFERLHPFPEANMINFPQTIPSNNNVFEAQQKKRQRKRAIQETQETLPKELECPKEIKTAKKPEIKKKQTNEQAQKNQTELKKRTKKVDWLNLGVNLSEKEKTLLKRLSGKKNRELSQSDRLEWKRLRDRISARHSRQKKKAYLTNLESKVSKLQKEKSETDQKLSRLELENKSLLDEINKLKQIVQIRLQNCSNQNNLTQPQIINEPPNKQRTLLNSNKKAMIGWMN